VIQRAASFFIALDFVRKLLKKVVYPAMKRISFSFIRALSGMISGLALLLALHSASTTCFFSLYQPEVPKELL